MASMMDDRITGSQIEREQLEADAARYRWLRDKNSDVALVLDKVTGEIPADGIGGGYKTYEYRAGEELDAAIDAAMLKMHNAVLNGAPETEE